MHFATKYCGLNQSQYGSKAGMLCHSVIVNKILTYNILQDTKEGGAYAKFNAVVNYDCMVTALVVL